MTASSVTEKVPVGHGLAAAGLVERVTHVEAESLEQLQGRNPNLGIDQVDIAGYKQTDPGLLGELSLACRLGLRRHLVSPFRESLNQVHRDSESP